MKTTSTGYRVTKNGSIISTIEKEALKSTTFRGYFTKECGFYYYYSRKQGDTYIYLP